MRRLDRSYLRKGNIVTETERHLILSDSSHVMGSGPNYLLLQGTNNAIDFYMHLRAKRHTLIVLQDEIIRALDPGVKEA